MYLKQFSLLIRAPRVLVCLLCFFAGSAHAAGQTLKQQDYAAYRERAIVAGQARNEKVVADNFFEDGNFGQAAKLYLHALSVAPDAFSFDEKKLIATRLAKAKHQSDAVVILKQLLAERDNDLPVKLEIVKLLAALQQHSTVIAEVDAMLKKDSGNTYALLIKADSLRRQKRSRESIPVYRSILEQGGGFDARLGLVYSLLEVGGKTEAQQHFNLLEAKDDAQEERLSELATTLDSHIRPTLDLVLNRYTDSDKNRSFERGVIFNVVAGNFDFFGDFREKTVSNEYEDGSATAKIYSLGAVVHVTDYLKVTTKQGRAKLIPDQVRSSLISIGQLKIDAKVGASNISANVSWDVLSATMAAIADPIQVTKQALELTQPITDRLRANLAYANKSYSDENSAKDYRAAVNYVVYSGLPQIGLGYGYHGMDYKNSGTGGYSAPQSFVAHQVALTGYYEIERYYLDINLVHGSESYQKDRVDKQDTFHYYAASLGIKATRNLSLELNAENSNSAISGTGAGAVAGSAGRYDDLVIGTRLSYFF